MRAPDAWPACCVVRAHDRVRSTEPNDVNGAARPSEQQAVERFGDATATKRLPSSRCASKIQIVRPLESIAEAQPQLQPDLLRLSAIISQYRFTAAFPRRVFGSADRSAADRTLDRGEAAPE